MGGTLAALALLLAGCGFMQVGERPLPSIPGSVAATAWQSQDPVLPGTADDLAGASTPEAFLEQLIRVGVGVDPVTAGGLRYGILGRDGDQASAYLQLTDERQVRVPVVAFEAHLTLVVGADGSWTLGAVETREQCGAPLVNGLCGDNSGGGGGAAPAQPTSPPT